MEFRKYPQGTWYPPGDTVADMEGVNFIRKAIFLPPRSMLLMSGEGRYAWHHYIPHHKVQCYWFNMSVIFYCVYVGIYIYICTYLVREMLWNRTLKCVFVAKSISSWQQTFPLLYYRQTGNFVLLLTYLFYLITMLDHFFISKEKPSQNSVLSFTFLWHRLMLSRDSLSKDLQGGFHSLFARFVDISSRYLTSAQAWKFIHVL